MVDWLSLTLALGSTLNQHSLSRLRLQLMIIRRRLKTRTLTHPVMCQVCGAERPRSLEIGDEESSHWAAEATKAMGPIVLESSLALFVPKVTGSTVDLSPRLQKRRRDS